MIEEIRINNLGVIEQASLACDNKFTAITGETGAGKTMLISALSLLTGARADSGAVRHGARKADVEATFILGSTAASKEARDAALEAGAALDAVSSDAQELLISRTIGSDGRSKAYAGGRTVPVSLLSSLGEKLLTLHGQNDQVRLRSEVRQRDALDAFGASSVASAKQGYQKIYRELLSIQKTLEKAHSREQENARERAYLGSALAALKALTPEMGEEEKLRDETTKLAAQEEIRQAVFTARQALAEEEYDAPNAVVLLLQAVKALEGVVEADGKLAEMYARLTEASYAVSDVAADLSYYLASLDDDAPARLEQLEQRRAALAKLVRDYAQSPADGLDDVIEWGQQAARQLAALTEESYDPQQLSEQKERLKQELQDAAALLTKARHVAGAELSEQVTRELGALAMERARFVVEVTPADSLQLHGADRINFLLAPHSGARLRPLGKGASGGELSRVMLALEVSLAQSDPVDTFVFDEIDAGIGGKTAAEIGKRLALLAYNTQVLAVTHSPQIAAFATRQIQIFKDETGSGATETVSDVRVLDGQERVVEIARMLAGKATSDAAQAHAVELLQEAESFYGTAWVGRSESDETDASTTSEFRK